MNVDPPAESLATLVSVLALWAFARWPLRRLRRDLARESGGAHQPSGEAADRSAGGRPRRRGVGSSSPRRRGTIGRAAA